MAERFYLNCPLQIGPVVVEGPEARHLAVVCRLRAGDSVCLFNGDGCEYPGRVAEVGKKEVLVEVEAVRTPVRELPFPLEVAVPLPRGDRGQFLVEKLTELGVGTLVLLETRRTVRHPGEGKVEKLVRYVVEASKQCGRNVLMRLETGVHWEEYVRRGESGERRWLAHPGAGLPRPALPGAVMSETGSSCRLAVGPEGGFTEEETALALEHGWQAVGLGPRILRVETAAVVLAGMASVAATSSAPGCGNPSSVISKGVPSG